MGTLHYTAVHGKYSLGFCKYSLGFCKYSLGFRLICIFRNVYPSVWKTLSYTRVRHIAIAICIFFGRMFRLHESHRASDVI
jgi:hypothetical protein